MLILIYSRFLIVTEKHFSKSELNVDALHV